MTETAAGARKLLLTLQCRDRIGIVADVARFLSDHGCNIVESAQFGDRNSGMFFLRTCFDCPPAFDEASLRADFASIAERFAMTASFFVNDAPVPVGVRVSKLGHCLNDLLFRSSTSALPVSIKAVVSNHRDFERAVRAADIPFHYLPVTPQNKVEQEARLQEIVMATGAELIVLARYMQILSPEFCAQLPGRIINIHHSFLPASRAPSRTRRRMSAA